MSILRRNLHLLTNKLSSATLILIIGKLSCLLFDTSCYLPSCLSRIEAHSLGLYPLVERHARLRQLSIRLELWADLGKLVLQQHLLLRFLWKCLTFGINNLAIVECYLLVSNGTIHAWHSCLSIISTVSCLSHRYRSIMLNLLAYETDVTLHGIRILVWTTLIFHVPRKWALHWLTVKHGVHLISTVFWLSIGIRLSREGFLIITLFLIEHHIRRNLGFYHTTSQLTLHLLRQFIELATWWWEWFGIDGPTRFLPLLLLTCLKRREFVLRAFLTQSFGNNISGTVLTSCFGMKGNASLVYYWDVVVARRLNRLTLANLDWWISDLLPSAIRFWLNKYSSLSTVRSTLQTRSIFLTRLSMVGVNTNGICIRFLWRVPVKIIGLLLAICVHVTMVIAVASLHRFSQIFGTQTFLLLCWIATYYNSFLICESIWCSFFNLNFGSLLIRVHLSCLNFFYPLLRIKWTAQKSILARGSSIGITLICLLNLSSMNIFKIILLRLSHCNIWRPANADLGLNCHLIHNCMIVSCTTVRSQGATLRVSHLLLKMCILKVFSTQGWFILFIFLGWKSFSSYTSIRMTTWVSPLSLLLLSDGTSCVLSQVTLR